ncbi:hypothetical protein TGPRC2_289380 [Toxoplasma gondii TgCatPRC2]|uniref:Transmembrane protein n=6 Tax=Toxoplasma gondii TaxID=5811 RepID=A0A151HJR6_TOXGO|nr:hypothetical protein TGME49_289380 [Toxoplasma gondii ME49]EPT27943.1 hypothetical protein TGME49_289380 [Toxoplasma gondii ME49]KYK69538.1 hypothetical protein TGPRC2_289380 [Toxoplasma gondii TgCatPRC2]|eukprot:XP_002368373.1 hypothetical protein TGME49_289380 [Toxoplasma gondii ME49]
MESNRRRAPCPPASGVSPGSILCLFLLSLLPCALGASQKNSAELLDSLACVGSPPETAENATASLGSWEQVPCLDAASVSVFTSRKEVQAGNILLFLDIDDTVIASGGWNEVMGNSLGGVDDRYPRGSEYPGFSAVLFLLALGPHARNLKSGQLTEFAPPSKAMVVTARPNLPVFRPPNLMRHLTSILTRGARQIMGDNAPEWGVGSQNVMKPASVLRGTYGRGENKLSFMTKVLTEGRPVNESRIDENTKVMFVGDSAERDLEVAIGLSAMVPDKVAAHLLHVVYRHNSGDPTQMHASHTVQTGEKFDEDGVLSKAAVTLQEIISGAARTVAAATRALTEKDEREKHRQTPRAFTESQPTNKKISFQEALGNTTRFGIRVGHALVDAIALVYDVYVTSDDEEGPRSCAELSASQAFEVGVLTARKIRLILDLYRHRWLHTYSTFRTREEQEAAGASVSSRMLPIFFVKCGTVKLRVAHEAPRQAPLDVLLSEMTGARDRVTVRFRSVDTLHAGSELDAETVRSNMLDTLGIPVVPYVTSISAVAQAYVLGIVDLTDVLVVVRKTYEMLRAQGPLAQPARLLSLLDHFHDLEALRAMLFPGGKGALPASAPVRVRATVDYLDELGKVQKAFIKRAAYLRAVPTRTEMCIREMERNAESHYDRSLKRQRGAAGKSAPFTRSQFSAFVSAFAELVCKFDVELSSVQFAGGAEVHGLSVYLSRLVRQAVAATETTPFSSAQKKKAPPESPVSKAVAELAATNAGTEKEKKDPKNMGRGKTACTLSDDVRVTFATMYKAFCADVARDVCHLLETRLVTSGVLSDFIFLAQERGRKYQGPLRLPHLGRVVFIDEHGLDDFEVSHQKPLTDVIGSMGAKLDEAIMEQASAGFRFAKWPGLDSWNQWTQVAASLQLIVDCGLLNRGTQ